MKQEREGRKKTKRRQRRACEGKRQKRRERKRSEVVLWTVTEEIEGLLCCTRGSFFPFFFCVCVGPGGDWSLRAIYSYSVLAPMPAPYLSLPAPACPFFFYCSGEVMEFFFTLATSSSAFSTILLLSVASLLFSLLLFFLLVPCSISPDM